MYCKTLSKCLSILLGGYLYLYNEKSILAPFVLVKAVKKKTGFSYFLSFNHLSNDYYMLFIVPLHLSSQQPVNIYLCFPFLLPYK